MIRAGTSAGQSACVWRSARGPLPTAGVQVASGTFRYSWRLNFIHRGRSIDRTARHGLIPLRGWLEQGARPRMGGNEIAHALVKRVRAGERAAFGLLVRKYQHKLTSLISRYIKD